MRHDPYDPERAFRPPTAAHASDLGPLFGQADPPVAPRAPRTEQRVLPLARTPEAVFETWLSSEEGAEAYRWMARRALEDVGRGATRLSAKALVEACRSALHTKMDNRITPLLARKLEEEFATLRDCFELRRRVG